MSDTEDDNAGRDGPKRSSAAPVVEADGAAPHDDRTSDVVDYAAAAAGLLVPMGDNCIHNG